MLVAIAVLSAAAALFAALLIFVSSRRAGDARAFRLREDAQQERYQELEHNRNNLLQQLHAVDGERVSVARQLVDAQAKIQQLAKYSGLVETEGRAAELLDDAKRAATTVRDDAARLAGEHLAQARIDAQRLIASARETDESARTDAKELRAAAAEARRRAEEILATAHVEAARITEAANMRAEEIAGDAYAALTKKDELEETARAMRNVIEGYGDKYLVPTYSLLDELADEFGYAEAGKRLAAARESMRMMIRTGTAAACEYAEETRRTYALRFVLDAFNGKVEDVLTKVRHDNVGTLEQEIRDAFTLVNHNGRAFRDARITPAYLDARVEELRWACVAHDLKLKEREEQRAIKERIREEERAQREFERAMKEAQKEEDVLKKAMEKVQAEVAKASDAQKAKYEAQLAELAARLHEAEEKNQRALSMAQQTRSGFVYVISNVGSFGDDIFKIGLTRRLEPLDRIRELGDASVPFDFDVHAMIRSDDAPTLERELHKKFVFAQMNKVNPRKEFFRVRLHEIRAEVEKLGIPAAWTMAAAAKDYRESQTLERELQNKAVSADEWAKRQIHEHDAAVGQLEKADAA
jgi:hypothetical protein